MTPFTILGIAGSLRKHSWNRAVLRAAQQLVPDGVEMHIFELDGLPLFNQDDEQHPPVRVTELKAAIRAANAILIATPEYNYSVPAVLKNAIDWASRPYGDSAWSGKPVAILGASPGTLGTVRAQMALRQMSVFLDMHPLNQPEVMITNAHEKFDAQGNLTNEKTRELVRKQLARLVEWSRQLEAGKSTLMQK
jgi:chromate reductase, NAD(P)H dehydrogenase (quinone)